MGRQVHRSDDDRILRVALDALKSYWQYTSVQRQQAAIALRNYETEASISALIEALDDMDPAIRRTALQSLQHIGRPASKLLLKALQHSKGTIRRGAAQVLGETKTLQATKLLQRIVIDDEDWSTRAAAAIALGEIGDVRSIRTLGTSLREDADYQVREAAANGLGKIGGDKARRFLKRALDDENQYVRVAAEIALDRML